VLQTKTERLEMNKTTDDPCISARGWPTTERTVVATLGATKNFRDTSGNNMNVQASVQVTGQKDVGLIAIKVKKNGRQLVTYTHEYRQLNAVIECLQQIRSDISFELNTPKLTSRRHL